MIRHSAAVLIVIGWLASGESCWAQIDTSEQEVEDTLPKTELGKLPSALEYFDSLLTKEGVYAPPFAGEVLPVEDFVEEGADPRHVYDIILQPGHYGRTEGNTGAQGAKISERELVANIVGRLASRLTELKLDIAVIPADDFKRPLSGYIFLSVHADGSSVACSSGPSLGYEGDSDLLGMHLVAYALATSLDQKYTDFMKDRFTVNLAKYYAYRHMRTRVFKGLLEVGELSCAADEAKLIEQQGVIADNLAYALDAAVTIGKAAGR